MKCLRRLSLALVAATLLSTTGCLAMAAAPVNGYFYTDVRGPLAAESAGEATKVGMASCQTVMGFVAWGDASIDAAAKKAGITKIHHVDFDSYSMFGAYACFTTIVYGE